ncbi:MAG: Transcriptional regulator, AcrR family [uncultured Ramlibacter sp.]|uniref:Transcriptional regulator, AcrR family n=1 Tax=uncultured Ramlibacter sp. TaxID=260755 RepID=A0A6J4QJG5_9BURK|nr:MAG: Transcriptional regulator, AcrR family [uncultured Ramlibacter sp.]
MAGSLPLPETAAPRTGAKENRERILAAIRAAAIAEFSEKGLSGTSTQAIAARAGLTKPQLHYYIKGKEDLYEELLMSVVADWKSMFDAGSTDPGRVLADYIGSKVRLAFEKPEVSRILTREVLDGGRNLDRFWPDSRRRTREKVAVINGWIARGLMKPVDPQMLLMHIWAMTQFYADSALQVQQLSQPVAAPNAEAVAREITRFVLRGCGLPEPHSAS